MGLYDDDREPAMSDFHMTDMDKAWAGYGEDMSAAEDHQKAGTAARRKAQRERNAALLVAWERLARARGAILAMYEPLPKMSVEESEAREALIKLGVKVP